MGTILGVLAGVYLVGVASCIGHLFGPCNPDPKPEEKKKDGDK